MIAEVYRGIVVLCIRLRHLKAIISLLMDRFGKEKVQCKIPKFLCINNIFMFNIDQNCIIVNT